ncbi:MAG: hypothetical protein KA004_06400 [Verrucomicrobiales bacterium]|nr:hypothetical protein [Verrucomicrobiales bacterium]
MNPTIFLRLAAVLVVAGNSPAQVEVQRDPSDATAPKPPPATTSPRPSAPAPTTAPSASPAPPAAAPQTPSPVDNLRVQQETELKTIEESLARQEWDALRTLEKARVEKGNYEGAARVVTRLQELEKAYPVLLALSVDAKVKPVVLEAGRSYSYTKGFGIVEKDGVLTFLKADSYVRWDNVSIKPGRYRVRLHYSTGTGVTPMRRPQPASGSADVPYEPLLWGGRVSFVEDTDLEETQPLSGVVAPTEMHSKYSPLLLGALEVTSSRAAFIVKAVRAANGGLMNLKSIELIPETAAANGMPKEFADLQVKYHEALGKRLEPTRKAWLAKLKEFETAFTGSGNASGLAAVKEEQTRLLTVLASPNDLRKPEKILLRVADKIALTYTGEIRPSNTGEILQRLRPAGSARVSFKLGKILPGKYQVVIHCNTSQLMGGTFRITCGSAILKGKVETPAHYTAADIQAGSIAIAAGTAYLDFLVESLMFKDGSLCELRSIELIPAES